MNDFIVTNFTKKVKENIEKNIYTKLNMLDGKVVMYGNYIFEGITFPNEKIKFTVIESFNNCEFADKNKIIISTYNNKGMERIVAYFE